MSVVGSNSDAGGTKTQRDRAREGAGERGGRLGFRKSDEASAASLAVNSAHPIESFGMLLRSGMASFQKLVLKTF